METQICKCCKRQITHRREDAEYCKECKEFIDNLYPTIIKRVKRRLEAEMEILSKKKKITKEMKQYLRDVLNEAEIEEKEKEKSVFDLSKNSSELRI